VISAPRRRSRLADRDSDRGDRVRRRLLGDQARIPEAFQQFLDRPEPQYLVSIEGLPARLAPALEAMKANTVLKRGNKTSIACAALEAQQVATGVVVAFGFPKDDPVSTSDKESSSSRSSASSRSRRRRFTGSWSCEPGIRVAHSSVAI